MNAILLSIGDELASGLTLNTNSAWLAARLAELGIRPTAHVTVGDDVLAAASAIRQSCAELELNPPGVLLITGGLGPTEDDLTRQALADALQEELVEDPDAMLQIENWFTKHGRTMSASNRLQALRPHSATILENLAGTAPGLRATRGPVEIFVMPGVPREMREMFAAQVLPRVEEMAARGNPEPLVTRVTKVNTFGAGESVIGERIKDLMARGGAATGAATGGGGGGGAAGSAAPAAERGTDAGASTLVGTTASDGIVSVRIYSTGTRGQTAAATQRIMADIRERLGPLVFGENEQTLEGAAAAALKENKYTVATAESCTGGLIATLLTHTAGSSAYFLRGWVTYANAAKHDDLGVPEELIRRHGAVSEAVARAMAEGARKFAQADFALATTGIAGPEGGTADKPVGTVWIALAGPDGGEGGDAPAADTQARRFIFPGDRAAVRLRASQMALAMLRWRLLRVQPPV